MKLSFVRALPHLLIGLAIGATSLGIGYVSKVTADEELRFAVDDIESDCDDQLSLLLHIDASEIANLLARTNCCSAAELTRLSEIYGIDEFTLVDEGGRIAVTTDPGAKAGDPFFTDESKHGIYRELIEGRLGMVRQRFRQSATCSDRSMKYFGLALPADGASGVRRKFLQIGFLWESFEREFRRYFLPTFETRLVGESGYCVVLDAHDSVVVDPRGRSGARGKTAKEIGFTARDLAVPFGKVFYARLFGGACRCLAYPETVAGLRIYAAMPLSDTLPTTLVLMVGVALVLLAVFVIFRVVLRKFHRQQAKIDALRAVEEEHRAADLALARSIQQAELRTDGTEGEGYRIASRMQAAREVGGDFYDYYELPDGRLVLTIADVSGKGVPAAFFMMKARMTLKSCVYSCVANLVDADVTFASSLLADAVARANVRLARNNPAEMFVTAWVGVYDRKTGMLDYVSAGHNPPLIRHVADEGQTSIGQMPGRVEWLSAPRCAALGVFEQAKYRGAQIKFATGDRLFLYTDGVTEAMNPMGELFGNERLEAALGSASGGLVEAVGNAVGNFVAGAEQSDDITMLELHLT